MVTKWLYRKADGLFILGGFVDPTITDPALYGVVELESPPDPIRERFDAQLGRRDATPQEINAAQDALVVERSRVTSRQKDVLATCAVIVRYSNPTAWEAMTLNQKKNATMAAADIWEDIRVFVEKNL